MRTSFIALVCLACAAGCVREAPKPAYPPAVPARQSPLPPEPPPEDLQPSNYGFNADLPPGWHVVKGREGPLHGKAQNDQFKAAISVFDTGTSGPKTADHLKQFTTLVGRDPAKLGTPTSGGGKDCLTATYPIDDETSGRIAVCMLGPNGALPVGFIGAWPKEHDAPCADAFGAVLKSAELIKIPPKKTKQEAAPVEPEALPLPIE
jgi:hypothetical protein